MHSELTMLIVLGELMLFNKRDKERTNWMIVSFRNSDGKMQRIKCEIITRHSSSYGRPVLVSSEGDVIDEKSWVALGYQVVSATTKERYGLKNIGLI